MPVNHEEKKQGLEFTETMRGFFVRDPRADFQRLDAEKPDDAESFEFTLTVLSNDLDALLGNPDHRASLNGTVNSPALSAETMDVADGIFNLFVENADEVETRNMIYRCRMYNSSEKPLFMHGYKTIQPGSPLRIWHDTTTLYITLYDGADETSPALGRGILRIEPMDFAKQLTTMRALNSKDKVQELKGLARFGVFFADTLYRTYGGVLAGPSAFNPDALPRKKRPLQVNTPEVYPFTTEDGVNLRLTRYRGGAKGPVILSHGLGVSSEIYSTDTIDTNLLEFLYAAGYDTWLLDFRASILLEASQHQSNGDQIAKYDYPASVAKVRQVTGAASVQFVVHCWGSTTFFMSMLAGLQGVRSFVASQIATHSFSPLDVNIKTGLHVPDMLEVLGVKSLTAYASTNEGWLDKIYDQALKIPAMLFAQGQCDSATCHRITFMYASLYTHFQLSENLHENLHELFGLANIETFEHLAKIGRAKQLIDFEGIDSYLPNLGRLNLPIAFIHGEKNQCFLPESTQTTYDSLCSRFNPSQYSRHVIPSYGHIDCIFGKNASNDVYPYILAHLEKTN